MAGERSVRRVAVLSLHTSPLAQPGSGDAGGMNVYIAHTVRHLAEHGITAEIFTRAATEDATPMATPAEGVTVWHVPDGPHHADKHDLHERLPAFTAGVADILARIEPVDLIHSHYWLSGQAGLTLARAFNTPLVHTAHTLARVKNRTQADGEHLEPDTRIHGECALVARADRLVANTAVEASQLVELYDADPRRIATVYPGVDQRRFTPGDQTRARAELDVPADAVVPAFVGRIQPLKAPDVLVRAAAVLARRRPRLRDRLVVLIVGGPSGSGLTEPAALRKLAVELGVADLVRFLPPCTGPDLARIYRAADLLAVPSHNESFGLVALEAQACGTPVVAADVGGLPIAVADGVSGVLVAGHDPVDWAEAMARVIQPEVRARLAEGARRHAAAFSWDRTARALLATYDEAADDHRRLTR